jgi:hypothetical protein
VGANAEYLAALPDLLGCGHFVKGKRFVDDIFTPDLRMRVPEMNVAQLVFSGQHRVGERYN